MLLLSLFDGIAMHCGGIVCYSVVLWSTVHNGIRIYVVCVCVCACVRACVRVCVYVCVAIQLVSTVLALALPLCVYLLH